MSITPCKDECHDHDTFDGLLKDLVAAQFAFGRGVLGLFGAGAGKARDALGGVRSGHCDPCCEMPEACWMPKALGDIDCRLTPGCTGQVRLNVTNNDFRSHHVVARSSGQAAAQLAFAPPHTVLGPKERTTIVATFTAPQQPGTYEAVVWVSVCSSHYLRWTVKVGEKGCPCCYEVEIDDNPDHVVHWYDHFYCPRPCFGGHRGPA